MDSEIAFIELGQDGNRDESSSDPPSFFHTSIEQRIGMIGSGIVIALSLLAIAYLVIRIRRENRQRGSSTSGSRLATSGGGGLFDKNMEMGAEFPYSHLSNEE